ncbi:MAG: recombinase family protein [Solirubrobacteraceae bacterium]
MSPALQRERIEGWAKLQGAALGEVFEELDESGACNDRPLLVEALRRVECGESQGGVVAKIDRFGRSGESLTRPPLGTVSSAKRLRSHFDGV